MAPGLALLRNPDDGPGFTLQPGGSLKPENRMTQQDSLSAMPEVTFRRNIRFNSKGKQIPAGNFHNCTKYAY